MHSRDKAEPHYYKEQRLHDDNTLSLYAQAIGLSNNTNYLNAGWKTIFLVAIVSSFETIHTCTLAADVHRESATYSCPWPNTGLGSRTVTRSRLCP